MENIWDWCKKDNLAKNLDTFIGNLQKANDQDSILLSHQMINNASITQSTAVLFSIAKQNPHLTDKVVTAALNINTYLNKHYKNSNNRSLNAQKLAVPAMLETLREQIQNCVHDNILMGRAYVLISETKSQIKNDETKSAIYNGYFTGYKATLKDSTNKAPVNRRQKCISI